MKLRHNFYWVLYLISILKLAPFIIRSISIFPLSFIWAQTNLFPCFPHPTAHRTDPIKPLSVPWPYLIYPKRCSLPEIPSLCCCFSFFALKNKISGQHRHFQCLKLVLKELCLWFHKEACRKKVLCILSCSQGSGWNTSQGCLLSWWREFFPFPTDAL